MKRHRLVGWICGVALFAAMVAQAAVTPAPVPAGAFKLKRMMTLPGTGSVYNPRICDGEVFGVDIGAPFSAGRFLAGSTTPDAGVSGSTEARMLSPLGRTSKTWVIGAGGDTMAYFSRLDYATMTNRVYDTAMPIRPNAFDWVDNDTVITASYQLGWRNRLYLVNMTAAPFTVTTNTTWNANGYVEISPATTRIRTVSVGNLYSGYAYFGNSGTNTASFWAINLATGITTELGTLSVTGGGSWGLWTVKEVGGYLYLQTTTDGIFVYKLTNATTLGALVTHHTKAQINLLTGDTAYNYGFDVSDLGQRMVVGVGTTGKIAEFEPVVKPPAMRWQRTHTGSSIYYGGAVKDHQFYTGQIDYGPELWDNAGNVVASTNINSAGIGSSKCSLPLGPYVFFSHHDKGGIFRINGDWQTDLVGPVDPGGAGSEALATDGTYLYGNDDTNMGVVHKYAVSNDVGSFTLTEVLSATTGLSRIRGLNYHNGKLYAADALGTNVVEVDANTGSSTTLFALPPPGAYYYYQAVRSGNRIYVIGTTTAAQLYVYETDGTSWTAVGSFNLGLGAAYGISDVDDGHVWVTSTGTRISYWSLRDLPFTDDFESYPENLSVGDLAYNGWSGSAEAVVKDGVGTGGGQAAVLPGGTAVTNTLYPSAAYTEVWTDMLLKPVALDADPDVNTGASVMLYVNAAGYAVVYDTDTATWEVCSDSASGEAVTPIGTDAYARITLYKNYAAGKVAVFVDGVLVREGLSMISSLSYYRATAIQNSGWTNAYLDNVTIATTFPDDLTGDSDGDGWYDAQEIDVWGSISAATNGVPYTWLIDRGLTDPDGDADLDSLSNAEEYLAGTSPTDNASFFQILSIERSATETILTIMGNDSGADSDFVIERGSSLADVFEDYDTVKRGAAPANTVYTNSAVESISPIFYRVKATP